MPEIKTASSCSSEADMVKCVCIAESQPVSMIHFVLSDRVLPRVKVEQHGTVTIGTLHAEFGSSRVVLCVANNTLGNANITLSLPVNCKEDLYVFLEVRHTNLNFLLMKRNVSPLFLFGQVRCRISILSLLLEQPGFW